MHEAELQDKIIDMVNNFSKDYCDDCEHPICIGDKQSNAYQIEQLCKDYARGVANEIIGEDDDDHGHLLDRPIENRNQLRAEQRQKLTERLGK